MCSKPCRSSYYKYYVDDIIWTDGDYRRVALRDTSFLNLIMTKLTKLTNRILFLFSQNFQTSSHSSYKSSPMPKLNPLDGEEIRRNSPANTPVGLNPTSVSIKQEKLDAGLHPNMPDIMTVSKIFLNFF